jgi:uncharacterized membrane protein YccC
VQSQFSFCSYNSILTGATPRKGFNRGLGTLSAGALALAVVALASDSGWTLEPIVIIINVFTTG